MTTKLKKVDWDLVFSLMFSPLFGSFVLGTGLSDGNMRDIFLGLFTISITPLCLFVFYPRLDKALAKWSARKQKEIDDEYLRAMAEIDKKYHPEQKP